MYVYLVQATQSKAKMWVNDLGDTPRLEFNRAVLPERMGP